MSEPTVLYIKQGYENSSRTLQSLADTNELTTGQVFFSIANHFNKTKVDYPRWISFENNHSEFLIIKEAVELCPNDLEKFNLICEWLGESILS